VVARSSGNSCGTSDLVSVKEVAYQLEPLLWAFYHQQIRLHCSNLRGLVPGQRHRRFAGPGCLHNPPTLGAFRLWIRVSRAAQSQLRSALSRGVDPAEIETLRYVYLTSKKTGGSHSY
jgi:hypothetical protein